MTQPRALLILAPGAEEMEVTIVADVLRRASIEVVIAGLEGDETVRCSRQVMIKPDLALSGAHGHFDAVILPGGAEGAKRLAASAKVAGLLRDREQRGELVAAICAAPTVFAAHGVFAGRKLTGYPSFAQELAAHAAYVEQRTVEDQNLITGQGPGTAFEFALAIVARLQGKDRAAQVQAPLLLRS